MKFFVCLVIALLLIMFSGCTSEPTEADVRKVVEKTYSSFAKVTDFRKTSAQPGGFLAPKVYRINYEAEIEYTKNGIERNFMGRFSSFKEKENPQPLDKAFGTIRKEGDRRRITGSITFERTKKGWRPVSGTIPVFAFDRFATTLLIIPIIFSLLGVAGTIVWIWAIIDCATKEPQGTDKVVWILVILLTHFIGALIYLLVRRSKRIQEAGPSESSQPKATFSKVVNFKKNSSQYPGSPPHI